MEKKLNVLFVHQAAELYGSDRVLLALVERASQNGIVSIVVLPEHGPLLAEFERLGVEVHVRTLAKVQRSAFTPYGLVRFLWHAYRAIKQLNSVVQGRRIDIVHSNTIAVLSGALWARRYGVRHVWHIHEIIVRPLVVANGLAWMVNLLSDQVACISHTVQDNLVSRCPSLRSKSVLIPNGIECLSRDVFPARADWRVEMGFGKEVVVGLIGRINSWKGQALLVQAASILVSSDPDTSLRFVIVGGAAPGQEYLVHELNQKIEDAGISDFVQVIGFTVDTWPIWVGIDIAVVPSTDPEPFGMVALEAMCASLPVIASGHGGLLDIVVDGDTGRFFEPGNASSLAQRIEELAKDPLLRRQMGERGRRRVCQEFSLNAQVAAFRRVYE